MATEELARALETRLGEKFTAHESLYLGIYFRLAEGHELMVQPNLEGFDVDPEVIEQEFADFPTLLYVNDSPRLTALQQILADLGLTHLRSDTVT